MAMKYSFGGRRAERVRPPEVNLDPELLGDLREVTSAMVTWPVA